MGQRQDVYTRRIERRLNCETNCERGPIHTLSKDNGAKYLTFQSIKGVSVTNNRLQAFLDDTDDAPVACLAGLPSAEEKRQAREDNIARIFQKYDDFLSSDAWREIHDSRKLCEELSE